MTVQDIISLCNAGFTAQQITQMAQPQMAQSQMVQRSQMVQMPQMAQPQMVQPQMVQPQMVQPQMTQPQMTQPQMTQPQMTQPQMTQPQMAQQYVPVLPTAQNDPMKDIMLQQYTNAGQNMYNVNNVVSEMIGANAPAKNGGAK